MVQVAALSSAERAATLAHQLGGRVVPLGKLYRVQLGPFADSAQAQRARDGAARRGYGDARIVRSD
jgi:rare lipoprotein A